MPCEWMEWIPFVPRIICAMQVIFLHDILPRALRFIVFRMSPTFYRD